MKLVHAARLSIAFLVVVFTLSLTVSVLAGGGGYSRSPKPSNNDPRTVLVQLALVSAAPNGSSSPAIDLLREQFIAGDEGAKPIDHAAFLKALAQARTLVGAGDLWLSPALAAQHGEKASLQRMTGNDEAAKSLSFSAKPDVLDKDIIRADLDFDMNDSATHTRMAWSTALTLADGAVVAIDLTSIDPQTAEPTAMLLVVRASIVTKKPS